MHVYAKPYLVHTLKLLKQLLIAFVVSCFASPAAHAVEYSYLSVDLSVSADPVVAGEPTTLSIMVENFATTVATNVVVTITLPPDTTDLSGQDCTQSDPVTLVCALPELGDGAIATIPVNATIHREGHSEVTATLNADNPAGGSPLVDSEIIAVQLQSPDVSPVELEAKLIALNTDIYLLGVTDVTAVVRNNHDSNTALLPVVNLVMPESIELQANDSCIISEQTATCKLMALAPRSETEIELVLIGRSLDAAASVVANVSSTQPDILPQNNEAELITAIISRPILSCGSSDPLCVVNPEPVNSGEVDASGSEPTEVAPTETPAESLETGAANVAENSTGSGGGALSPHLFFLLLLLQLVNVVFCRREPMQWGKL